MHGSFNRIGLVYFLTRYFDVVTIQTSGKNLNTLNSWISKIIKYFNLLTTLFFICQNTFFTLITIILLFAL